jgi:hypothetical protein
MELIIAGYRKFQNYPLLREKVLRLTQGHTIATILSGKCEGTDSLGERFAKEFEIPVDPYPADWNRFGKAAGPIRNGQMVKNATHAIVFDHPLARGSKDLIRQANAIQLPLRIVIVP